MMWSGSVDQTFLKLNPHLSPHTSNIFYDTVLDLVFSGK